VGLLFSCLARAFRQLTSEPFLPRSAPGFECACPGCALPEPLASASDARVARLASLFAQLYLVASRAGSGTTTPVPLSRATEALPDSLPVSALERDLEIIDEMRPLAQEEGLFDLERTLDELWAKRRREWLGPRGMGRIPGKDCCECCL
jgi:hypothetical protein